MAQNVKQTTYILRGKAKFPCLNVPKSYDNSSFSFVEDYTKGAYTCTLLFDKNDKDLEKVKKSVQKEFDTLFEEFKQSKQGQTLIDKGFEINQMELPIVEDTDKEGKKTGKLAVKFKRNAVNSKGDKAKIQFIDRFKNPINPEDLPELSTGSDLAIRFNFYTWNKATDKKNVDFGITLCILGVQIIEAVTYGGDNSWGLDFEEDEEETAQTVDEVEIDEEEIPF